MAEAGFQEVETYIYRCQNTATQFIATRPIIELCLAVERRQGSRAANQWWQQYRLDLEGMQTAAQEEKRMEGGGEETDGNDKETD